MTIEDLLEECGGFGKFQIMIICILSLNRLTMGWSMLQMSFAGFIPDWHCETGHENLTRVLQENGTSDLNKCSLNSTLTGYHEESCHDYQFEGTSKTIITQWDLVCDRKYIKATVTSIQMVGVLVGAVVTGQLSDWLGRKKTFFSFGLAHALLNIGAAFSPIWEVFATFRFFIGIGVGGLLVVSFPYPMEFLPVRWRSILLAIPTWMISVGIFSVSALLLDDWSYLHIACGVFGLVPLIGFVFVPESVRWLTIYGHLDEAEKVFNRMAKMNSVKPPTSIKSVLEKVYKDELEKRSDVKKYSYLNLFKGGKQLMISLIFMYLWFILSLVYYGISFGVSALAGNLYLNIYLLALVEIPGLVGSFFLNNKFGRKPTNLAMFLIAVLSSAGCLVVQFALTSSSRGTYIRVFSLVAKLGIGTAWAVIQVWCSELYPTVVRSLAYGLVNSAARLGGIAAPFVLDLDNRQVESYVIITALLVVAFLVSLLIPETKGKELPDSFCANSDSEKGTKMAINGNKVSPMDKVSVRNGDSSSINADFLSPSPHNITSSPKEVKEENQENPKPVQESQSKLTSPYGKDNFSYVKEEKEVPRLV